jgi:anti-anti-sigma factor
MAGAGLMVCARDGYTVVALRGQLDVCTAVDSVRTLTAHAASGARIIVDLAELTFIDCSSLREVISVFTSMHDAVNGGPAAPLVL